MHPNSVVFLKLLTFQGQKNNVIAIFYQHVKERHSIKLFRKNAVHNFIGCKCTIFFNTKCGFGKKNEKKIFGILIYLNGIFLSRIARICTNFADGL